MHDRSCIPIRYRIKYKHNIDEELVSEYCGLIFCLVNLLTIQGVTELSGKCYELINSNKYLILS